MSRRGRTNNGRRGVTFQGGKGSSRSTKRNSARTSGPSSTRSGAASPRPGSSRSCAWTALRSPRSWAGRLQPSDRRLPEPGCRLLRRHRPRPGALGHDDGAHQLDRAHGQRHRARPCRPAAPSGTQDALVGRQPPGSDRRRRSDGRITSRTRHEGQEERQEAVNQSAPVTAWRGEVAQAGPCTVQREHESGRPLRR